MKERNNENVIIGTRLREIRKNLKKSQEEIAWSLGLSTGHYRKIETGMYNLSIRHVITLNHLYGVDPSYLIIGEKESFDLTKGLINCSVKERNQRMITIIGFLSQVLSDEMSVEECV